MLPHLFIFLAAADAAFGFASHHVPFGLKWRNGKCATHHYESSCYMSAMHEKEAIGTQEDLEGAITETLSNVVDEHSDTERHQHLTQTLGHLSGATSRLVGPIDQSECSLINSLQEVRATVTSCPELWRKMSKICPKTRALFDEHLCDQQVDLTYEQVEEAVRRSAAVFANLGVNRGDKISIFGENSAHWLIVDHGIQSVGAVSVVRGADAPPDELRYIYDHSDSKDVVVLQGPTLITKLANDARKIGLSGLGLSSEAHGEAKTIILMHREKKSDEEIATLARNLGITIHVLTDLLNSTPPLHPNDLPKISRDDLSTIVYTSGTTGRPKGVMLTHGNLLHQVNLRFAPTKPYDESEPLPGDVMVSILPIWHITERTAELCILSRGCTLVYSSIRYFKNDLIQHKPHWMMLVPRVLEKSAHSIQEKLTQKGVVARLLMKLFSTTGRMKATHSKIVSGLVVADKKPNFLRRFKSRFVVAALSPINRLGNKLIWSKVQAGLGGNQKLIVSGGSALAGSLESFYEVCGIPILVGYGLTECAPLISHRRSDANLVAAGCVGRPICDTEVLVADPVTTPDEGERPPLPDGNVGVVLVRGPQVMRGYYKNDKATKKAIDSFGWFDTGDLGKINPATGDLIIVGRCKDTIVLSNGENIEPTPIEDAIMTKSKLIEQVMLTGHDKKQLTAIVVLDPTELANAGFLDRATGEALQHMSDVVNDPKCTEEDCIKACEELNKAAKDLRENPELKSALKSDLKKACADFRTWEQVGDIYITLEPFAMANGLLTQSYKVKRDSVLKRYENELNKK